MKDAFQKAGLNPTVFETKDEKRQTATQTHQKKTGSNNVNSDQIQIFCENCSATAPDVERYEHRSHRVQGCWLCVKCADQNEIDDSLRKTAQSTHSKQRMFKRSYGRTNRFVR